jgi:hypothetical protein
MSREQEPPVRGFALPVELVDEGPGQQDRDGHAMTPSARLADAAGVDALVGDSAS